MSKYNTLAQNTLIFALGNLLSKLILSMLLPLYTRILSTAQYGTAELITSYVQLIMPIASLSIGDALFRYTMDRSKIPSVVLANSYIVLGAGTILLIILTPVFGSFQTIGDWSCFLVSICICTMWRSALSLYTKAMGKTALFAIDSILYNLLLAFANILLLTLFRLGINGYFWAQIIANIISITFLLVTNKLFVNPMEYAVSLGLLKKMLVYSIPLIFNSISWGIMGTADRVMLTSMVNASANGLYAASAKIPSLLSIITGVFTQAWSLSAIMDYEEEKDSTFYENVFRITHIGVTTGTLMLLFCNNLVFPWLLGKDFGESVRYVPCLLMGTVFLTYSNYFSPLFSAVKNTRIIMISAVIGTLANLVLNHLLIPISGVMGACIATTASYFVIAIIRFIYSKVEFRLDYEIRKVVVVLICLTITSIIVTFGKKASIIVCLNCVLLLILYKGFIESMVKAIISRIKAFH